MKTYSANSGYVYQYYFAGQRTANREGRGGTEYVFQVSADRKTECAVSVFVEDSLVDGWVLANGRELRGPHRYAIAKIALRNALDERQPHQVFAEIRPLAAEVAAILEELDV
jgi:hypothetical protein